MHASEQGSEFLRFYFDLAEWSNYAGIVTDEEERSLLHKAEKSPREAEGVLQEAKELREIIFRIFSSIDKNAVPQEKDIFFLTKNYLK